MPLTNCCRMNCHLSACALVYHIFVSVPSHLAPQNLPPRRRQGVPASKSTLLLKVFAEVTPPNASGVVHTCICARAHTRTRTNTRARLLIGHTLSLSLSVISTCLILSINFFIFRRAGLGRMESLHRCCRDYRFFYRGSEDIFGICRSRQFWRYVQYSSLINRCRWLRTGRERRTLHCKQKIQED